MKALLDAGAYMEARNMVILKYGLRDLNNDVCSQIMEKPKLKEWRECIDLYFIDNYLPHCNTLGIRV